MFYLFFILLLLSAIFLLYIFSTKKKKISMDRRKYFSQIFNKIKKNTSLKSKIIDYDKLYHNILKDIGYKGTFGEILKLEPKEIRNLNKIWELHKIRNKLVHEFDEHTSLDKQVLEYEKQLKNLFDDLK